MKNRVFLQVFFCVFYSFSSKGQECVWLKGIQSFGTTGAIAGNFPASLVTDASGNVYLTGNYSGDTFSFASTILTDTIGSSDKMFLTKCDSSGHVLWAKSFGTHQHSRYVPNSIAIDAWGNIFVSGSFSDNNGGFSLGSVTLTSGGAFLAKFSNSGNPLWATSVGGGYTRNYGTYITTDVVGNVFITGGFDNTITFGSTIFSDPFTYGTAANMYLAKYDSSGNFLWALDPTGTGGGILPQGIAADAWGNVYVTGGYEQGFVAFGSDSLPMTLNTDMFLAKFNGSGGLVWLQSESNAGLVTSTSVAASANGYIFVTGYFGERALAFGTTVLPNPDSGTVAMFLASYDTAGSINWANSVGCSTNVLANSVSADARGNCYLTGSSGCNLTFGTSTLDNAGMFVAVYNSAGVNVWAGCTGNTSYSLGRAAAGDNFGHVYLTGEFQNSALMLGTYTLSNPALEQETFLARYNTLPAGIPLTLPTKKLSLFPDPVSTLLTVESGYPIGKVTIRNIMGQVVYAKSCSSEALQIDMSGLPPGMYLLNADNGDVEKFVKE